MGFICNDIVKSFLLDFKVISNGAICHKLATTEIAMIRDRAGENQ